MPYKKDHQNNKNQPKRNKKKNNKIPRNFPKKNRLFNQLLKLVRFENLLASRVEDKDIIRACSLYNRTQEKIIKLRISRIYFN